ncbi:MAG: hypothetical protein CK547_02565 [Chitinophagaceae bacterium]|nr:MAG: hypothetical protein CK547_02565 [Chitinophagaceae bacterium]
MESITPNRPGMTERAGVFILIALMGAGFVVGGGLSFVIWKAMTGESIAQMQESMMNPSFVNEVRVIQTLLAAFIFFIPAFITAFLLHKRPFIYLGLRRKSSLPTIGIGMALMAATIVLSGALASLTEMIPVSESMRVYFKGLEDTYMKQVLVLSQMTGIPDLLISILVMGLAPAIFEEVFFRGGLQQMMTKATGKVWFSIIFTSLLFSAIHFSFYGFLSRAAMGILLGLLFARSGNLWIPILAHFLNNTIGVIQVYILRIQGKNIADNMDDKFPLWSGLLALVVIYTLFIYYTKSVSKDRGKGLTGSIHLEALS